MLDVAEREQIVQGWNATQTPYPLDRCLHDWIERQAEATPDAAALVFEGRSLSYRETNARANQLAHHLRSLGVGPEVLVGVCAERSFEMVIALLGILKAGGAYVPIDPSYPAERLAYLIDDAQAAVVIADCGLRRHGLRIADCGLRIRRAEGGLPRSRLDRDFQAARQTIRRCSRRRTARRT